ncbi:MAG: UDP-glucose 4-epimerase GalE [Acidobacteriia bacterium]|nr:UDP-glucose 4-epimerase GalE [Terriglobia bacterium]
MRILVTGGAGYIGSVVVEELLAAGQHTVVYDNLSLGHRDAVLPGAEFVQGEILDRQTLESALTKHGIDAVIHMAANALVGESCENPAKYYTNNLVTSLALLEAMRATGVSRLVLSSTAAVYGESQKPLIDESDATRPTNPYGETKLAFERACHWYEQAYGMRYVSLRYFNAAGATKHCGERHDPETHLIPLILQAAAKLRPHVEIFGDDYPTPDGTCVRDYIHVSDLAHAHVLALDYLKRSSGNFNLGCGGGHSVMEVVETARSVTGREIPVRIGPRRPGDPAVLVASSEKIKRELGWVPEKQELRTIITSAWEWMQQQAFVDRAT